MVDFAGNKKGQGSRRNEKRPFPLSSLLLSYPQNGDDDDDDDDDGAMPRDCFCFLK